MGRPKKATMEVVSETGVKLKIDSFLKENSALVSMHAQEISQIEGQAKDIVTQAGAIVIDNQERCEAAGELLKVIKGFRKKIEDTFKPICEAAHKAWKTAVAGREAHDGPMAQAEAGIKYKMSAYLNEQERLRRVEEQRLQAEAQKAAEEQAEQDALLMEATGDAEAAEVVRQEPVVAPVVVVAPVAKPQGISTQSIWRFRITNASIVPREFLAIDEKRIGAVVRAMKSATNIPGVEIYEDKIVKSF